MYTLSVSVRTMSLLTDSDRRHLAVDALCPIPKIDDRTQLPFYVISAQFFEQVRPLIPEQNFEPREFGPLIAKTASAAGWNDSAMNAYDHYDDARPAS